jgi:hypothetical protein
VRGGVAATHKFIPPISNPESVLILQAQSACKMSALKNKECTSGMLPIISPLLLKTDIVRIRLVVKLMQNIPLYINFTTVLSIVQMR